MKKELIGYVMAGVFAIFAAVSFYQSYSWRQNAEKKAEELERLKSEKNKPVVKLAEKQEKVNIPAPELPPTVVASASSGEITRERRERPEPEQMWENMRNRFEEMRDTNPERYQQIMQRINEFTATALKETNERMEFFKNLKVDPQYLSPEELEKHNRLMELMEKNSKKMAYLLENPDSEEASQIRMELMQSARELRDLMDNQRTITIRSIGIEYGLSGDKLKQFEQDINKASSMTSLNFGRFVGGGSGMGGGRRDNR